MDLMKVFDQTVREIKREVNKKVLKVPEIETKVLEATSNEPWGPHGTLMGEIANATRNYNDYQMIMDILWRRTTDTGKNWRHVYKALTLFEFLLANADERVISDLRERSYQLSTLVDFQFVEPNGKDQGINVRKKAETILSLINDKEKIKEVRQKAQANRNKYRGISSTGGLYDKPNSYSSTSGAYGNDQLDEDRYGSTGRYGRDKDEDHYGREDLNKDDYGEDRYNSRNGEHRDRLYDDDDDDRNSSRNGGGKQNDYVGDDGRSESKQSRSRMSAPPNYKDVSTEEKSYRVPNLLDEGEDVLPTTGTQNGFSKFAGADEPDDFDFDPRASSATTSKSTVQSSATKAFPAPSRSVGDDILFGDTDFNPKFSSAVPPSMQFADNDLFGDSVEFKSAVPAPFDPFKNLANLSTFPTTVGTTDNTISFNPIGSVPTTQVGGSGPNFPSEVDLFGDFEGSVPTTQKGGGVGGPNISTGVDLFGGFEPIGSVPTTQADPFGDMSFGEFSSSSTVTNLDSQTSSVKQPQLKKDKFEPKSKVWADELSKGLIDLNIGGPKSNSLAELGISLDTYTTNLHFEKKEEKISTIPTGKAMGSGSGLGIAGATLLTPPSSIRPSMGMGSSYMGGIGMPPPMGGMGNMGVGSRIAEPSMNRIAGEYPNKQQSYGTYR